MSSPSEHKAHAAANSGGRQEGRVKIERETFNNMSDWKRAGLPFARRVSRLTADQLSPTCSVCWAESLWNWMNSVQTMLAVPTAAAYQVGGKKKVLLWQHVHHSAGTVWFNRWSVSVFLPLKFISHRKMCFSLITSSPMDRPWRTWWETQKKSEGLSFTTSRGLRRQSVATSTPR